MSEKQERKKAFLSTSEVADRLGVTDVTMRTWRARNEGPRYYKMRNMVLYRLGPQFTVYNQGDRYNASYMYGGENYMKALHDVVVYMYRTRGASEGLSPLFKRVVHRTNELVYWVDSSPHGHDENGDPPYGRGLRWAQLKAIDAVQAAELVFLYETVRMVCVKETIDKETSEGVFANHLARRHTGREQEQGRVRLHAARAHRLRGKRHPQDEGQGRRVTGQEHPRPVHGAVQGKGRRQGNPRRVGGVARVLRVHGVSGAREVGQVLRAAGVGRDRAAEAGMGSGQRHRCRVPGGHEGLLRRRLSAQRVPVHVLRGVARIRAQGHADADAQQGAHRSNRRACVC